MISCGTFQAEHDLDNTTILDLCAEPYDPRHPKLTFEEQNVQLVAETYVKKR
ncbi:MAG TPA: hypothetical protein VKJ47_05885 [Candidatus Binatia bacterium]|nr:hypothetical protein [Candidatus Binatia bacterium]